MRILRLIREIGYPAVFSFMCLLRGEAAHAAEWMLTQMYSASTDYDDNRLLELDGHGTASSILTADLRFTRALEDTEISLEPRYSLRRFSDPRLGNGDDRSLFGAFNWRGERNSLSVTGSVWDQSTLLTELLETGIVQGNTYRLTMQAAGNWVWTQTELFQLIAQVSDMKVSYHGAARELFSGYQYPSGSVGERFVFSEKGSITLAGYGSSFSADIGNSSSELGVQTQLIYSLSERTRIDAWVGESSRRLAGQNGRGTDAVVSLTHEVNNGNLTLNYSRTLVPYGIGFLVQRQQVIGSALHQFSTFVDGNISVFHTQANRPAVLLRLDRSSYTGVSGTLNWHITERLNLGAQVSALQTQAAGFSNQTVREWRTVTTLTWNPYPATMSR